MFLTVAIQVNAKVISNSGNSSTVKISIDGQRLKTFTNPNGTVSFYQAENIAVPLDGDFSVTNVTTGSLGSYTKNLINQPVALESEILKYSKPVYVKGLKIYTLFIFPVVSDGVIETVQFDLSITGSFDNSSRGDSKLDGMLEKSIINYSLIPKKYNSLKSSALAAAGPFESTEDWIKLSVNQNGVYRVTGAQLDASGYSVTGQASSNLHLYNAGGKALEVYNNEPRPEFNEVAIIIEDGGDGIFNTNDYFLFYGESLSRYVYDSTVQYVRHAYADNNIYWVSFSNLSSGHRMTTRDVSLNGVVGGSVDTTISRFEKRVHVEQDNMLRALVNNEIDDYYTWFWSNQTEMNFFVDASGIVPNDTVDITLVGKTIDTTGSIDEIGYIDLYINSVKGINKNCNLSGCTYQATNFINGSNSVLMELTFNNSINPYFDYMEYSYESYIQASLNKIEFALEPVTAAAEILLQPFSVEPLLLDISDPQNPVILEGGNLTGNVFTFYDQLSGIEYGHYSASQKNVNLSVSNIAYTTTKDLYTSSEQIDCFVVAPQIFENSMLEYINYRENQGNSLEFVSIEDIMDNFSFGLYDPTAIRDFLKNAYETYPTPRPSAVLFVGDANYDFKNYLSTNLPNYVPAYIHEYDHTSSDDNYVYFGSFGLLDSDTTYDTSQASFDIGYDMVSSRWPVRSSSEIAAVTAKFQEYESSADFGIWRNNITIVADDEYGSNNAEYFHTTQAETLENSHLPLVFNRDKIYLWEYPFVSGEKPDVNDAIVKSFNSGSLLVNYIGHGNPNVWAHENVFSVSDDLPRLQNEQNLPLVVAASCAIGFFDDPFREGMAERLLAMDASGCIGVISATRLVYSSDNSLFNRKLFDKLFYDDGLTICEAVYAAKIERQYNGGTPTPITNDRNYLYFGDPFTKLAIPYYDIQFTNAPDSFNALGKVTVSGEIIDANSNKVVQDGTLFVKVLDSEREKTYQLKDANGLVIREVDYSINGPVIYNGSVSVTGGDFTFEFIPPLDIGFGGNGAKISAYASLNNIDASGYVDSIAVADSIYTTSDSLGPEISIHFDGHPNFVSGDIVSKTDIARIQISDESGINLAGGLGHGLSLVIDNQTETAVNLNNLFESDKDSYQSGAVEYALSDLSGGSHNFKIKAWDNANNFTTYEFDLNINTNTDLEIVDLLNYPNPMQSSTRFSFTLTQAVEKFVLDIFTLSGKKINSFVRESLEPTYYDDIVWNGQDLDGDRVATEVYIYKATAHPSNGGKAVESFGKIILIN
ncbi:MAG: hypothetical protein DWP97_03005 [Calditrichaeota bacterium]|nr:MAG: hypothetical protein DWP97_03005 [Calditrichota bacterium]